MLRNFIAPPSNTSKIAASYNRIIQISVIAKFVWKKHRTYLFRVSSFHGEHVFLTESSGTLYRLKLTVIILILNFLFCCHWHFLQSKK